MAPPHRSSQPSFARPHSNSQGSTGGGGGPPPPPPPHYTHARSLPGSHHMNAFARVPSSSSPFATPLGAIATPSSSYRSTIMSRTSNSRAGDGAEDDDDEIPGDDDEEEDGNGNGDETGEPIDDDSRMSYSYMGNTSQSSSQSGADPSASFDFPPSTQSRGPHSKHRLSQSSHHGGAAPPLPPGMSLPPSPPKPGMPHDPYVLPPPPPFQSGAGGYQDYDQHHAAAASGHYPHGAPYDPSSHEPQTPASGGAGGQSNAASPTPSNAGSTGKGGSPDKGRRTRVSQACDLCRKRKARCIGGRPVTSNGPQDPGQKCQRCTKQNADCQWSFFSDTGRQATTAKKRGRLNGCVVRENGEPGSTSSSSKTSSSRRRGGEHPRERREQPSLPTPYQPEPAPHSHAGHHYDAGPYQDRFDSGAAPFHPHLSFADYPSEPPPPPSWSPPSPPSPGASSSGGGPPAMPSNGHGATGSPPFHGAKRARVSPPGLSSGSRSSARQLTLDAAAVAREAQYGLPPEAQSQDTQAMAERRALVRSLEEQANERGQHGRQQPLVMEMMPPSAGDYRNGNRGIPPPRAILSDGMSGQRKRKRSPLSRKEEIQAAILSSRRSSPREPRQVLADKLALRRQQRVTERLVGHATWAKPLFAISAADPMTEQVPSLARARRNSIGSSQPTEFLDASVARWLEDNPERWGVVDAETDNKEKVNALAPFPVPEAIDRLPACRMDRVMVSASTQPITKAAWTTSSRLTIKGEEDLFAQGLEVELALRRVSSSSMHMRFQDAIDAKLAGEDEPQDFTTASAAALGEASSNDLSLLLGLSKQSNATGGENLGHGRTAFGYDWPPSASSDDGQALPPSQQQKQAAAALPPHHRRSLVPGNGASDSQIESIFDLTEAGLPSQQASQQMQQRNMTAAAVAMVQRHDAEQRERERERARETEGEAKQRFSREEDEQAAVQALNNLTQTQPGGVVGANMFAMGESGATAAEGEGGGERADGQQ